MRAASLVVTLFVTSLLPQCSIARRQGLRRGMTAIVDGVLGVDTEPTLVEWNLPEIADVADAASAVHDAIFGRQHGPDWAPNPKNGTPWYRFKRTDSRGESSHSHFEGLRAKGDFRLDSTEAHNVVRTRVGLTALRWSADLERLAADRVRHLAERGCYIKHSKTEDRWQKSGFAYVGENLYKVINMEPSGVDIVDAWYAEIADYQYGLFGGSCTKSRCAGRSSPPCTLGHFTQVMWESTTNLGCARAECPGEARETFVVVCNYGPGGNIVGSAPFRPDTAAALGLASEPCNGG
eukprot:TRINITY_DN57362_c0_g1_i1.p1 TRINITY_DN57362_c0_g1~~TRINITY_DN57362_c0_g1_i1.p1  ORF type:complete len:293 (-),score=28.70 TRINITY_DN57362_c0_g1_i1:80-958(-)